MAERLTPRAKSEIVLALRGALAQPASNEDDPFDRALLTPCQQPRAESSPVLRLQAPDPNDTAETIVRRAREAVAAFRCEHHRLPSMVSLPWGLALEVRHGVRGGAALGDKIALVTGAAGAIGAGICRGILKAGGRVVAGDISEEGLASLAAELQADPETGSSGGDDCVRTVRMDVTDAASVEAAFQAAVSAWGGVDIVIANAGLALVSPLDGMDLEAFRRLQRVNVEGTLLTLAEAGRCLKIQGTGGDIVLISTKNVFAPGASFGAYSATKAAAHQLARIASLEYAPHGIRVNMVAPDAVFGDARRRSGLWAEVGPSRMRARGLDEKGLEEYYRNRNLLKARVTVEHVARAVLFFVTRQTPTTGATLPVDGGLPDATPR